MKILVDELPWSPSECLFYDGSEGKCNVNNGVCFLVVGVCCNKLADLKTESEGE